MISNGSICFVIKISRLRAQYINGAYQAYRTSIDMTIHSEYCITDKRILTKQYANAKWQYSHAISVNKKKLTPQSQEQDQRCPHGPEPLNRTNRTIYNVALSFPSSYLLLCFTPSGTWCFRNIRVSRVARTGYVSNVVREHTFQENQGVVGMNGDRRGKTDHASRM